MLLGNGGNGKSVFLAVLRKIFGFKNCRSVEPCNLGKPFEAIHLKDALLNICSDINTDFRNSDAMFKKIITGDDAIHDSYKGKDCIDFIPRVKMICAMNSYMTYGSLDNAILRRLMFIRFTERYEIFSAGQTRPVHPKAKKADTKLLDKLEKELPGIMNWIIKGYKRLKAQGGFTITDEHKLILHDFKISTSPVNSFISEELLTKENVTYSLRDLYARYQVWCQSSGYHAPGIAKFKIAFENNIDSHIPDVVHNITNGMHEWVFPPKTPEQIAERLRVLTSQGIGESSGESASESVNESMNESMNDNAHGHENNSQEKMNEVLEQLPFEAIQDWINEKLAEREDSDFHERIRRICSRDHEDTEATPAPASASEPVKESAAKDETETESKTESESETEKPSEFFGGVKLYPCPNCGNEKISWSGIEDHGTLWCGKCGYTTGHEFKSDNMLSSLIGKKTKTAKRKAAEDWNTETGKEWGLN